MNYRFPFLLTLIFRTGEYPVELVTVCPQSLGRPTLGLYEAISKGAQSFLDESQCGAPLRCAARLIEPVIVHVDLLAVEDYFFGWRKERLDLFERPLRSCRRHIYKVLSQLCSSRDPLLIVLQ